MFKKTLMSTLIVLSVSAHAATENSSKVANDYDCTINELQAYMGKKTESMTQRETAIAPFDDFQKGNVARTASSTAGGAAPVEKNPDGTPKAEECNYFWGDLEDIKYEQKDDSGILDAILSGDIGGLVNASKERVMEVATGMTDEIKKGVCKRLSTENVKKTVIDYGDDALKDGTGYGVDDVTDPDLNGFVNDGLKGGFGNTGKLINVFDPAQDKNRANVILKETDRQAKEMMKMN